MQDEDSYDDEYYSDDEGSAPGSKRRRAGEEVRISLIC